MIYLEYNRFFLTVNGKFTKHLSKVPTFRLPVKNYFLPRTKNSINTHVTTNSFGYHKLLLIDISKINFQGIIFSRSTLII